MSETYTEEEVAKHNTKTDCWIIVEGGVYDVTEFLPIHPGGAGMIMSVAGKDATEYFNELHREDILEDVGEEYLIGQVAESSAATCAPVTAGHRRRGMNRVARLHAHIQTRESAGAGAEIPGWPEDVDVPTYANVPRFAVGDRAGLDYLGEHGYAVIASALNADECAQAIGLQWDFMEALGTGVERGDPSTWQNGQWQPGDAGTGIMGSFGVGQNAALWYVRGIPHVKQIWEQIHETDELIVSFDGMCIFRNRGMNKDWTTMGGWFHTDRPIRGPNGLERGYVQGFVNLVRTSPEGGGNVVVPHSHKLYSGFAQEFEAHKDNRGMNHLDNEALKKARPDVFSKAIYTHMEAGDVFLWDDRTQHCNAPGIGPADPNSREFLRSCCYVSFSPKASASEEKLTQRRVAVREGRGSGHTGDVNQARGAGDPDNPQFKFAGLVWDDLTPAQQALVG